MKTINASEFKAKCLAILDEVSDTGEVLTILKHGRPVARLLADFGEVFEGEPGLGVSPGQRLEVGARRGEGPGIAVEAGNAGLNYWNGSVR